jgi:hypothetical protein
MKITFASVAFLLAFQASALGDIETDIPQSNRVILPSGAWTPSVEETQKAIIAIQPFLERLTPAGPRTKAKIKLILENTKKYRVQFFGVLREKRKVIRCNFFPTPSNGEEDQFEDWKHTEVRVIDGGFWFWQIEYDPTAGKCLHFSLNADA